MNRKRMRVVKKRKRRIRHVLLIVIILFLSLLGFGAYLAYQTYQAASDSYDDLGRDKSDLRDDQVAISKDPISILLMGVEDYSSGGEHGRSDTLMVATFNPDDERLKLLSIPRDTKVEIVGKGREEKINHAYAYGGKKMTIDTVENFLDIPIDYYASVNFDAFKNIIDTLGGVKVEVPFNFVQYSDDEPPIRYKFLKGEMELNGSQALAFARMRSKDPRGDIGRNDRQQEVIRGIIDKTTSFGTISKIDDLAKVIGQDTETNMKISEGISFFKSYSNFNVSSIDKLTLETYPETINGLSYQIAKDDSLEEVIATLKKHLELDSISNPSQ
ncbi:LCP family protein [Virgibacillus sp. W0430]|uniref:LCP family protein n=1 Tax=Virgibacillus sp. W0430 TaxID=3391580 RepID=UPI003F46AC20